MEEDAKHINSDFIDGMMIKEAKEAVTNRLIELGSEVFLLTTFLYFG